MFSYALKTILQWIYLLQKKSMYQATIQFEKQNANKKAPRS